MHYALRYPFRRFAVLNIPDFFEKTRNSLAIHCIIEFLDIFNQFFIGIRDWERKGIVIKVELPFLFLV